MNELNLFDFSFQKEDLIEIQPKPFKVGQQVVIRKPTSEDNTETYYYLLDFQGKKGEISKIGREYNPVAFFVEFGTSKGVFYKKELIGLATMEG